MKFLKFLSLAILLAFLVEFEAVTAANEQPSNDDLEKEMDEFELEAQEETDESEGETVISRLFNDNREKFNSAVEKLFKRMDKDKDGNITNADFELMYQGSKFQDFVQSNNKTAQKIREEIMSFDTNGDEVVGFQEWSDALSKYADAKLNIDRSMCGKAGDVVQTCKPYFRKQGTKLGFFFPIQRRMAHTACWTGISGMGGFRPENCALNANSCDEVASCYSEPIKAPVLPVPGGKLSSKTKQSGNSVELVKRDDADVWRVLFWTSMIFMGILAVGSVVGIPFFVIILIVANRALDFNEM